MFRRKYSQKELDTIYDLERIRRQYGHLLNAYEGLFHNIDKLSIQKLTTLRSDVRELISSLHERYQYWEHRRAFFLQLGLGILAFSIALIGVLASLYERLITYPITFVIAGTAFVVSVILLVGGVRLVQTWNRQNNPPTPIYKAYSVWRWQSRYAEEIREDFRYQYYKPKENEFGEDIETYLKNLNAYASKTLNLTPSETVRQDISQLFLLIETEKYKINFVSELRDVLTKWLKTALWFGLATVIGLSALFSRIDFQEFIKEIST